MSWSGKRRAIPAATRRQVLHPGALCYVCGSRPATQIDHVKPWVECIREGIDPDAASNLRAIDDYCHKAKTKKEAAQAYAAQRAKLTHPSTQKQSPGLL